MEIECIGEFDQEFTLKARAFKKDITDASGNVQKDPKGEVCGMLRILPNGQMYQRKVKIILVSVWTKLNGSLNKGNNKKGKERIKEILGQALISANEMIEVDINTEPDPNFVTDFCKDDGSGIFNVIDDDDTRSGNLKTYLLNKLGDEYKYNYKIFYFDEKEDGSNGYSWGEKYICIFNTANNETAAHELLHGLGLAHPFDAASKNTNFTYKFRTTNNVMDYTHQLSKKRRSLFHWQWQIINSKIR